MRCGVVRSVACGVVWCGVVLCGVVWCSAQCGMWFSGVGCDVACCGVVWCYVVLRGAVRCGVMLCSVGQFDV